MTCPPSPSLDRLGDDPSAHRQQVGERFKEPGQRQFVYRWRDDARVGCLQHIHASMTQLLELAESAQAHSPHLGAQQQGRLQEMREYYAFMVSQLDAVLATYSRRWRARNTAD